MAVCAVYAGSVLGFVRRPPLQRPALATIAVVCLLRAFVLPPLVFVHPLLLNTFEVTSAIVWFIAGVGFARAFRICKPGPDYSLKRAAANEHDVD